MKITKIENKNEIENEIENILKEKNILSDEGMVYASPNINSLPSKGKENLKKIIKEHAMLFEDDTYYYVVMNDGELLTLQGRELSEEQWKFATDFSMDKLKKAQYGFLSELVEVPEEVAEETIEESIEESIEEYLNVFGNIKLSELIDSFIELEEDIDIDIKKKMKEYLYIFGDIKLSELNERINELEEDLKDIDSINVP